MTALFHIAAEYRTQLAELADVDMPVEVVRDTIESLQGDLHDKLRAVIAYGLELDILAGGAKDAAKRMADRAKTLDSRAEALREYALTHMQTTGTTEIATDEWAAKIAKKPPAVQIADGAVIPAQYMRQKPAPEPEPDKALLKTAIQGGADIPGVTLAQGWRLAIK